MILEQYVRLLLSLGEDSWKLLFGIFSYYQKSEKTYNDRELVAKQAAPIIDGYRKQAYDLAKDFAISEATLAGLNPLEVSESFPEYEPYSEKHLNIALNAMGDVKDITLLKDLVSQHVTRSADKALYDLADPAPTTDNKKFFKDDEKILLKSYKETGKSSKETLKSAISKLESLSYTDDNLAGQIAELEDSLSLTNGEDMDNPIFGDTSNKSPEELGDIFTSLVDDMVTVDSVVSRQRYKYARVLTGNDNCAFCVMLASRGAVYSNRTSRGSKLVGNKVVYSEESSVKGIAYHFRCDCRVVPVFTSNYKARKTQEKLSKVWRESQKSPLKDGLKDSPLNRLRHYLSETEVSLPDLTTN